jgi:hypothetical protein
VPSSGSSIFLRKALRTASEIGGTSGLCFCWNTVAGDGPSSRILRGRALDQKLNCIWVETFRGTLAFVPASWVIRRTTGMQKSPPDVQGVRFKWGLHEVRSG